MIQLLYAFTSFVAVAFNELGTLCPLRIVQVHVCEVHMFTPHLSAHIKMNEYIMEAGERSYTC